MFQVQRYRKWMPSRPRSTDKKKKKEIINGKAHRSPRAKQDKTTEKEEKQD